MHIHVLWARVIRAGRRRSWRGTGLLLLLPGLLLTLGPLRPFGARSTLLLLLSLAALLALLGSFGTVAITAPVIASVAGLSTALLLLLSLLSLGPFGPWPAITAAITARCLRLSAPFGALRAITAVFGPLTPATAFRPVSARPRGRPVVFQMFHCQAHPNRTRSESKESLAPLVQNLNLVHFVQFNAQFFQGVLHGFLAGLPAGFNCFHSIVFSSTGLHGPGCRGALDPVWRRTGG